MDSQSKDILKKILERLDKMDSQQHKLDKMDSQQHKLDKMDSQQHKLDKMDSQQHKLDKMDSQQHKLDRLMERLDTLQNIIERQNQKQNLLDEKLVEMTIKRQQEKAAMAEQLQEALQEIVEPFRVIDSQGGSTPSPHKNTQPLQSLGSQIGQKLKSIEDRTVDTAQKCHQLTSWSHKMEDKMTQLASNSVEMETFLLEIRSVKDLIKGQTNSELIWLNNKMDKKLSDIGSVVRDIYQQQTETKDETLRSTGQRVKTDMQLGKQQRNTNEPLNKKPPLSTELCDKQMQVILDVERRIEQFNSSVLNLSRDVKACSDNILTTNKQSIIDLENTIRNSIADMNESSREQSLLLNETLKSDLNKHFGAVQSELETNRKTVISDSETQTNRIISAAETAKEDLKHLIQTDGDNTSKHKMDMECFHSLINSLINKIQENLETTLKKVDSTEASMISKHETANTKLEELTTDLKDYIYKTKREIFAVTEKEAQIVRDRIQGPLPSLGKYTFDFYVNNFQTLVGSAKTVDSLPWHINELQTCVTGWVGIASNGEMHVGLMFGRHPREVGLQPRAGKTLKVKATICDIDNKMLPPVNVGEESWSLNEAGIHWNGCDGLVVGGTSCDMLLEGGYGEQEGYDQGALLIRYEITVK